MIEKMVVLHEVDRLSMKKPNSTKEPAASVASLATMVIWLAYPSHIPY